MREIEEHLSKTYSDNQRHVPATIPEDMLPIQPAGHKTPYMEGEVETILKRARTRPLMKVAWEKRIIPRACRRAGGIMIPQEKNSIMAGCTISPLAFTMVMELIIRASRG